METETHRTPSRMTRVQLQSILSRVFVWGLIFLIVYLLRSFFLLMFLTFVFAYVQSHAVERLEPYVGNRTVRVVVVGMVFLLTLVGIGLFIVPNLKTQTELFITRYPQYAYSFDRELNALSESYPVLKDFAPGLGGDHYATTTGMPPKEWDLAHSPTVYLVRQLLGFEDSESGVTSFRDSVAAARNVGGKLVATGSAFFLSLLFSFLIVLDLRKLTESVRRLAHTRIGFIYEEVAESVRAFSGYVGRALEAQFFIALLNSLLTAIGIYLLGLENHLAFLSVIVFLFSFVPVAGVFISSAPICLLSLQQGGVHLMFFGIALILLIHFIETYFLNPKIYGNQLHVNPVLVLIILTIGGKLFGVWGLVLGLPVCTYFFSHAIRYKESLEKEYES